MTHFNWSIDYLMKYSSLGEHSDIVYKVYYTCTGINTSGILTTSWGKGGNILLSTENLENPIPYGSLTENDVQGWLVGIKPSVQAEVEGSINGGDTTPISVMPWD